jgi:predicted  nucleic acid-binding Zn-ribbon protein
VAATAIAVIALVDARNDESSGSGDAASEAARVQRNLERRISDVQDRIDGLATSDDVKRLEDRLGTVEDDAKSASEDSKRAGDRLSELERRVDDLQSSSGGTTTSP